MGKNHYRCDACNWKFSRSFAPPLCPYCGKAGVTPDTSLNAAEELVREVESIEEQMSGPKAN